jgi:hypothetical protein
MSSLMLPNFDLFLQMDGLAASRLFAEAGESSSFKRMTALLQPALSAQPGTRITPPTPRQLKGFMQDMKRWRNRLGKSSILDDVLAAISGDAVAQAKLDATGMWAVAAECYGLQELKWWAEAATHCAEVEQASVRACRLMDDKDYFGLFNEVAGNARLCLYFTSSALAVLRTAQADSVVLAVRGAAMLEFLLAQVARLAVMVLNDHSKRALASTFEAFLAQDVRGHANPGFVLFRWFKGAFGVKSIKQMMTTDPRSPLEDVEPLPSEATLKRWSSGKNFPSEREFRSLVLAIANGWKDASQAEARCRHVAAHYYIARRMDALLDVVRFIVETERKAVGSSSILSLLEASSPDDWMREGFQRWLVHWRSQPSR